MDTQAIVRALLSFGLRISVRTLSQIDAKLRTTFIYWRSSPINQSCLDCSSRLNQNTGHYLQTDPSYE